MHKTNKGISLLEILLVLVIATAIIFMAIRYFTVSIRNERVATAISQIKNLSHLSYEWLQSQRQQDFSGNPNGQAISFQVLENAGLINDPQSASRDPWSGIITISPGTNPNYVKITMENIPQMDCRNLVRQTKALVREGSPLPTCTNTDSNEYFGEF